MKLTRITSVLSGIILLLSPLSILQAADEQSRFSNTNIQAAYTSSADNDFLIGYGSKGGERWQFRFEHQSYNRIGENYVFADVVKMDEDIGGAYGEGDDTAVFALWNSNISLEKLFKTDFNIPLIKDAALEFRAEYGSFYNYYAVAGGASVYLDIPGFTDKPGEKVHLVYWRRFNCDDFITGPFGDPDGDCYDDHNFWGLNIRKEWEMFGMNWNHQTFFRFQQSTGNADDPGNPAGRHNRIFLELEVFAYPFRNFAIGGRLEYFWDEGGIDYDPNTFAVDLNNKDDWRPMVVFRMDF